jgi:hypothetical protein
MPIAKSTVRFNELNAAGKPYITDVFVHAPERQIPEDQTRKIVWMRQARTLPENYVKVAGFYATDDYVDVMTSLGVTVRVCADGAVRVIEAGETVGHHVR